MRPNFLNPEQALAEKTTRFVDAFKRTPIPIAGQKEIVDALIITQKAFSDAAKKYKDTYSAETIAELARLHANIVSQTQTLARIVRETLSSITSTLITELYRIQTQHGKPQNDLGIQALFDEVEAGPEKLIQAFNDLIDRRKRLFSGFHLAVTGRELPRSPTASSSSFFLPHHPADHHLPLLKVTKAIQMKKHNHQPVNMQGQDNVTPFY